MTIQEIRKLGTSESQPAYCQWQNDAGQLRTNRIVTIGRKYVQIISYNRERISPAQIVKIWR